MAFNLADVLKDVPDSGTGREQIEYIALSQLDSDANNFYQLSKVDELAANIQLCGLQQPIRVRRNPGDGSRYTIVSGHRRRAAVELLAAEEPERWSEVPCIVEADEASPALQQLRLIFANSSTRTMTPAEVSEQAVRVEKLLYELKEEGYDFPGRMRDHVAQAVNVSKSKLSRLKVIRGHLDAVWQPSFQGGKIGESVAYTLARMLYSHQGSVYAVHGSNPSGLTEEALQIFEQRMRAIDKIVCGHNATGICVNAREMRDKSCKDRWADPCASRCCYDCSNLRTCSKSCNNAAAKKKELKAVKKTAEREAAERQAEREQSRIDLIRNVYLRTGQARLAVGKTVEDVFAAQKRFATTSSLSDFEDLEQGTAKISASTHLPFGYCFDAAIAETMVAVADCLGCSIDWLLCRTDVKELAQKAAAVPDSGTIWQTGDPPEPGTYLLMLKDVGTLPQYEDWRWNGSTWEDWSGEFNPEIDGEIVGWIPMPQQKTEG